jgi:hypothetical protein
MQKNYENHFTQNLIDSDGGRLIPIIHRISATRIRGAIAKVRPSRFATSLQLKPLLTTTTVERYLTSLRKKGYLVKYRHPKGARRRKGHDLSPLIDRLKPLAHQRLEERRQRLREAQSVGLP